MIRMDHNQWKWIQSTGLKIAKVRVKESKKESARANMVAGFRGNPMVVEKED